MKFTKFPKIRQFRDVIISVKRRGTFTGLDENDQPIYNTGITLPTLTYLGTVKMHGTNAAVSKDLKTQELAAQSRSKIITEKTDNAGFARYVHGVPRAAWDFLFDVLILPFVNADNAHGQVTVFGEWIGPGVQKGVGISNIPAKSFVVFGVHVGDRDSDSGYWIPLETIPTFEDGSEYLSGHNIYLITDVAPTYSVDIDFNYPKLIQNKLVELTQSIEASCPVAESFGVKGIGEGIVWRADDPIWSEPQFWFKTKGDKHSASKARVIAAVDPIKVQNVAAFVDLTLTERRLEQGVEHLNELGKPMSRASTGDYIRWVINDAVTEEVAVLEESELTTKDVGSALSFKARQWFFNYLDTSI
jgi:hypothetical protein